MHLPPDDLVHSHVQEYLSAFKDSFQKLSLIRSKIFENAISRTHYEIKTQNFIHLYISLSLVCTRSFEVM